MQAFAHLEYKPSPRSIDHVASPGVDPVFPLREAWSCAKVESAARSRMRDRLERHALRLRPPEQAPDASPRLLAKRSRILRAFALAREEAEAALATEEDLIKQLFAVAPETIPGAVAKLQFIIRHGEPSPDSNEYP